MSYQAQVARGKFAFAQRQRQKRRFRVITFYSGTALPVFLLDIYAKSRKSGLTAGELDSLKKVIDAISREFKE